jgi:Tol biopolymer transport system component
VKPSNVLLDSSGNAFLMDFGIAKMVESTLDLTGASILGTPAYMSPEQCRGAELTPASDQYSLGIILYEMVTGRTPFRAETPIALIHMQLNEPLPLPRQVMTGLPEEAERVILKALTKDPSLRFPTCGDMAAAFARVVASVTVEQPAIDDLTIASAAPPAVTTPAVEEVTALHGTAEQVAAAPRKRRRLPAWAIGLMAVVVVLGLAAVAIVAGLRFFGEEEGGPVSTEEMATGPAEGMIEGSVEPPSEEPGISIEPPEESREVRPCDWEGQGSGLCIYAPPREKPIQKILEEAGLDLTGPGSWSPDGRQIAFSAVEPGGSYNYDTTIYIVNADGTDLTRLPQIGNDINPAWSPDGEWLVFHSNCGLAVMHPDGSEPSVLWSSEEDWCTEQPQWSPDSQSIVVSVLQSGGETWTFPMDREVWVVTDEGDTLIPITTLTHNNDNCLTPDVAFSPDGAQVAYVDDMCQTLLANADGSGMAKGLNDFPFWWTAMAHPQWGEGEVPPIMEPEPGEQPMGKFVELCEAKTPPQLCIFDTETEQITQITSDLEFESIIWHAWAPDGQRIVFDAGSDPETGRFDHKLYLINADGSDLKQLTTGNNNDFFPAWSPDGNLIAFLRDCGLWVVRPDGSQPHELLAGADRLCTSLVAWSPDSQQIAFLNSPDDETVPYQVFVLDPGETVPRLIHAFDRLQEPHLMNWSRDGRQLALWFGEPDQEEVFLINADGSGEPKLMDEHLREVEMVWTWLPFFWPQWGGK